jgi:subtilisin family serine protease
MRARRAPRGGTSTLTDIVSVLVLVLFLAPVSPRALADDDVLISSKVVDSHRLTGDFGRLAITSPAASAPGRLRFQPAFDPAAAAQSYAIGSNRTANVFPATDEVALVLEPGASAAILTALANQPWPVESLSPGAFSRIGGRREILLVRSKQPGQSPNTVSLQLLDGVLSTKPVHVDPKSGLRVVATDEVLVRLKPGFAISNLLTDLPAAGAVLEGSVGAPRLRCYQLRLLNPFADAFAAARRLQELPALEWATPNFVREIRRSFVPNDPLFPRQQHLSNTGQQGAMAGADIGAVDAWDQTRGTNRVVIAILDDGVDLAHADLKIRLNPGESGGGKETNGFDDDGDGFIDDFRGWNFAGNNNNPGATNGNGHGTGLRRDRRRQPQQRRRRGGNRRQLHHPARENRR